MSCYGGDKCANWLKKCDSCSRNPKYTDNFVPDKKCQSCVNLDEWGCVTDFSQVCNYVPKTVSQRNINSEKK